MKKQVTKETNVCDWCEADEHVYHECTLCGKHACFECVKEKMEILPHSCHFSGGCDGCYCLECLEVNPDDELIIAYRVVQRLRKESKNWYKDFKIRSDNAEKRVERLFRELKHAK